VKELISNIAWQVSRERKRLEDPATLVHIGKKIKSDIMTSQPGYHVACDQNAFVDCTLLVLCVPAFVAPRLPTIEISLQNKRCIALAQWRMELWRVVPWVLRKVTAINHLVQFEPPPQHHPTPQYDRWH